MASPPSDLSAGPAPPSLISLRALLAFDLFLLALLILATRLATLLHEAVGHALVAAALGAEVRGVTVSLFGGGGTDYEFGASGAGTLARFLAAFGGIGVNLLTGALPFALARRIERRTAWALWAALFAAASLLGAVAYAAMGFYYDHGDPVAWMAPPARGGLLWVPVLALAPVASYLAAGLYGSLQDRVFPAASPARRIALSIATLGAAGGAYAGLYALTAQRLASADAPRAAYRREEDGVYRRKVEEAVARARSEHPELSEAEIRLQVERMPIQVLPEEVPTRPPLFPAIAGLYAAAGLAALWRMKPAAPGPPVRVGWRPLLATAALATAALAGLAWTRGRIYG